MQAQLRSIGLLLNFLSLWEIFIQFPRSEERGIGYDL